ASRSELSRAMTTSAVLREGRPPEPAKMTSFISAARSALCELSPIAQRRASTRVDLPQPFGPTTPVRPGWMTSSDASTKDLKPTSLRRVSFMPGPCLRRLLRAPRGSEASASQKGLEFLVELLDGHRTALDLAVDEEGRRRRNPELLGRTLANGHHA